MNNGGRSPSALAVPSPTDITTGNIAANNISATNVTTTNLAASNINVSNPVVGAQYVFADQFPGATGADKINNAIASIVTAGATVDCTNLTGAQTVGATILVNKPIRLIFGNSTFTGSVNPIMNIASSNVTITSVNPKLSCFHQTTPPGNNIVISAGLAHLLIENICVENTGPLPNRPSNQTGQFLAIWAAGTGPGSGTITDLTVRNCFVGNGTAQLVLEWTDYSHILANEFVATAPTSPVGGGVPGIIWCLVVDGSHNVIQGNTIQTTGNVSTMIIVASPNGNITLFPGPNYNTVANNTLTALTPLQNEAIVLVGSYNTIGHNTLNLASTTSTSGINLYPRNSTLIPQQSIRNSIVGNTISIADGNFSPAPGGIAIFSSTADPVDYNVVSGNTISTPGTALSINGGSHNTISGNTAFITGGTVGAGTPLLISSGAAPTKDNVIIGNTLSNGTGYGQIDIGGSAGGLYIEGNRLVGNATTLTHGMVFRANSGDNSFVGGNSFSGNLNFGIYLEASSSAGHISIGFNHFATDVHFGDINYTGTPASISPATAGTIRMISQINQTVGVTLTNSVNNNRTWNFQDATDTFVGLQTPDTLSNKILNYPTINAGLNPGTGYQRALVSIPAIAASGTANISVTWSSPFADNVYLVFPSVEDSTGALSVRCVLSATATGVVVAVVNNNTGGPVAGNLWVMGIHF